MGGDGIGDVRAVLVEWERAKVGKALVGSISCPASLLHPGTWGCISASRMVFELRPGILEAGTCTSAFGHLGADVHLLAGPALALAPG